MNDHKQYETAEALNPPIKLFVDRTIYLKDRLAQWQINLKDNRLAKFYVRIAQYLPPPPILSAKRLRHLGKYTFISSVVTISNTLICFFKLLDSLDSYSANDVAFIFNSSIHGTRTIWADSTFLSNSSDYFKTMFESGFMESSGINPPALPNDFFTSPSTEIQELEDGSIIEGTNTVDSDDEMENSLPIRASDIKPPKIHKVVIKNTSYQTYRAVLCYLTSDEISFAPLLSNPPAVNEFEDAEEVLKASRAAARLGIVASPKSVYKLAHLLGLQTLCELALADYRNQLTSRNVIVELFSDFSCSFAEARKVGIEIATSKPLWNSIEVQNQLQLVQNEMMSGIRSSVGRIGVLFLLLNQF